MATEERSIEISAKLDVKDLIRNLESIPGITSKEAKKMAKAFDTQLKQTEKAAKKSAEASKKAAKATAAAARRGSKDFDRLAHSAKRADHELDDVADSAGEIDRGFSAVGLALRDVNPKLADAADGLADTFAVAEGLTLSFKSLNPTMLYGAGILGTLVLAYQAYNGHLEKAKEQTLALRDAQKSLSDLQKSYDENLQAAASSVADLREELMIATGAISEYEAKQIRAQRSAKESIQDNIDTQKKFLDDKVKELSLVKELLDAYTDNTKPAVVLSEEQEKQLQQLKLLTEGVRQNVNLTDRSREANTANVLIYERLQKEIGKIDSDLAGLNRMQERAAEIALQIVEYEKETADEEKRITDQKERSNKAAQKAAELEAERLRLLEEQAKAEAELDKFVDEEIRKGLLLLNAERELAMRRSEGIELEIYKIEEKYKKEFERIKELAILTGDQAAAQEAIDIAKKNRDKEISDARKKQIDEETKKEMERIQKTVGATGDLYASMSDLAGAFANENYKYAEEAFYIQKALSLASVTMKTAEAIMTAALSAPPPLNAIPIAAAAATGAAQLATVVQQQPSFHMGGLAPDEANARVLRGEAVLDRATVRRIGGEQGVQKLQEGKQENETVVIIQPFKHFGRFAREIGFKKPKQTGIARY